MASRFPVPAAMVNPPRARRSPAQWRTLIRAFERSGQTRRGFCARHDVALSTFDWWRKRLGVVGDRAAAHAPDAELFVELAPPGTPVTATVVAPAWDVELELGAGMVLRLRRSGAC